MKNIRMLAASAALGSALLAAPAMAQDSFTGPYVSIFGGISQADDSINDTLVFDTDLTGDYNDNVNTATGNAFAPGYCAGSATSASRGDCRPDDWDAEYGIRLGLDGKLGNSGLRAGLLVEAVKSDLSDATTGYSSTPASYTVSTDLDYAISARGRIGYAAGDSFLIYGTGGVSYGRLSHDFTTTNTANSFTQQNIKDWSFGWQGGGGAEVMLTRNISLGAEYLYSTYDDDKNYVAVGRGTAPLTNPFLRANAAGTNLRASDDKFDSHTLRATMSLRF